MARLKKARKLWIPTRGNKEKQSAYSVSEIRDEYKVPFVQLSSNKVDKAGKSTGSDPCQNFQILKCLKVIEKDKGHGFELGIEAKTHMNCNQPQRIQRGPDKVSYQNFLKLISILYNPRTQEQEFIFLKHPSS